MSEEKVTNAASSAPVAPAVAPKTKVAETVIDQNKDEQHDITETNTDSGLVTVKLLKPYKIYNAGEVASFDTETAKLLLSSKTAEKQ